MTVSAPEPRYVAPTQRDRIGRIWAPVYLDGKGPFRLVLDTGADHSAVVAAVAEALGQPAQPKYKVRVHGATGTALVPAMRIARMEIGDLLLSPVTLPIVLDVFGGADGVLGYEGLQDKRIVIDFRHDSITIRRSHRERPPDGFQTMPISILGRHLLAIDALVGHVRCRAILDTGAPNSLGNLALLEALKRRTDESVPTDIVGVTLDVERGSNVHMPPIRLQSVRIQGAVMSFGDVYIFQHLHLTSEPALMLGMDVLGVLDELIIDYKARELDMMTSQR